MRRLVLATSTLAAEPGLPDVLDRVATFAVELTGAGSVTVYRHDDPIPQSDEPALAIAIRVGGEDFATIRLSNQPNGQFSADDRWLAEQLAAIAGIAIEHLLLRESVGQ
jgi:GAF domain-containing protein